MPLYFDLVSDEEHPCSSSEISVAKIHVCVIYKNLKKALCSKAPKLRKNKCIFYL